MRRITVGNGVCMITEIRKESPAVPAVPRRRGFVVLFLSLLVTGLFNVWLAPLIVTLAVDPNNAQID